MEQLNIIVAPCAQLSLLPAKVTITFLQWSYFLQIIWTFCLGIKVQITFFSFITSQVPVACSIFKFVTFQLFLSIWASVSILEDGEMPVFFVQIKLRAHVPFSSVSLLSKAWSLEGLSVLQTLLWALMTKVNNYRDGCLVISGSFRNYHQQDVFVSICWLEGDCEVINSNSLSCHRRIFIGVN